MKTFINKISRKGYSNVGIAKKLGVSTKTIHNHRKHFNLLVDKAIKTHFFTKAVRISVASYVKNSEYQSESIWILGWKEFMRFLRSIIHPVYDFGKRILLGGKS